MFIHTFSITTQWNFEIIQFASFLPSEYWQEKLGTGWDLRSSITTPILTGALEYGGEYIFEIEIENKDYEG